MRLLISAVLLSCFALSLAEVKRGDYGDWDWDWDKRSKDQIDLGKRDTQQVLDKINQIDATNEKRDVIKSTESINEVTEQQSRDKRWLYYPYAYNPYFYGYGLGLWGRRKRSTESTVSEVNTEKRDTVDQQSIQQQQSRDKRWLLFSPYYYNPYFYNYGLYWGRRKRSTVENVDSNSELNEINREKRSTETNQVDSVNEQRQLNDLKRDLTTTVEQQREIETQQSRDKRWLFYGYPYNPYFYGYGYGLGLWGRRKRSTESTVSEVNTENRELNTEKRSVEINQADSVDQLSQEKRDITTAEQQREIETQQSRDKRWLFYGYPYNPYFYGYGYGLGLWGRRKRSTVENVDSNSELNEINTEKRSVEINQADSVDQLSQEKRDITTVEQQREIETQPRNKRFFYGSYLFNPYFYNYGYGLGLWGRRKRSTVQEEFAQPRELNERELREAEQTMFNEFQKRMVDRYGNKYDKLSQEELRQRVARDFMQEQYRRELFERELLERQKVDSAVNDVKKFD